MSKASVPGGPSGDTDRTRATYDWCETAPTRALMETLEAVIGTEPEGQLPLYESIEPDALNSLLRHAAKAEHRSDISLCFQFADHLVTVYGTGELVVKPLDDHR